MLLAAARKRDVSLTVQEWPGGEPSLWGAHVKREDFNTLKRHLVVSVGTCRIEERQAELVREAPVVVRQEPLAREVLS